MALNMTLEGLRDQILSSIKGRKLGLDKDGFIVGSKGNRHTIGGITSGTTLISTGTAAIPAYGISVVGSTQTSGSTALSLDAPIPGVVKYLFNVSTGTVTVTAAAGSNICSTASAGSTQTILQFVGKGAQVTLLGLSTALWGLATELGITTVTTGNLVQVS